MLAWFSGWSCRPDARRSRILDENGLLQMNYYHYGRLKICRYVAEDVGLSASEDFVIRFCGGWRKAGWLRAVESILVVISHAVDADLQ